MCSSDLERSSAEMVTGILDGMKWLGLDWDEGPGSGGPHAPDFSSQRYDRHPAAAGSLVADGRADYLSCSAAPLPDGRGAWWGKVEISGVAGVF